MLDLFFGAIVNGRLGSRPCYVDLERARTMPAVLAWMSINRSF